MRGAHDPPPLVCSNSSGTPATCDSYWRFRHDRRRPGNRGSRGDPAAEEASSSGISTSSASSRSRSFKLKYTGSALGYVWSLVKPLMLFGIMYLVFSILLKAGGKDDVDFPVQLLIAIVAWTFFTEATSTAMNAIAGNGELIRKAYFPRWILVVASTTSAMLTFAINTLLVVVVTFALGDLHLTLAKPARAALLPRAHRAGARALDAPVLALRLLPRPRAHLGDPLAGPLLRVGGGVSLRHHPAAFRQSSPHFAGLNPVAQIIQDLRYSLVDALDSTEPVQWHRYIGALVVVPDRRERRSCSSWGSSSSTS